MRKAKRKGKSSTSGQKRGKKDNNFTNAGTEMATSEPVKMDEGMPEIVTDSEERRVDTSAALKIDDGVPKGICADEEKKGMKSKVVKMDEEVHEGIYGDEEKREITSEPVKMDERVHEGNCGDEEKRETTSEAVKTNEGVHEGNCGDEEKRETASVAVKADEGVHEGKCGDEEKRKMTSDLVKMDEEVHEGSCGFGEMREMKSELAKVDERVPEGICRDEEMTSEPVKMDEEVPECNEEKGKMTTELVKMDEGMSGTGCEGDKKMKANKKEEGNNKDATENILNVEGNVLKEEKKEASGSGDVLPAKDSDEPETSAKRKNRKKAGSSMGMIFLCNSRTKKDCYHYRVLGMPSNKKEVVAKIYKGMRLFVFDIDLRLMYGIYKAAGPGGYKIEPKAFQSAFPAQVRFTVLEDCLPLPEEKFKTVIKDNYYGKKKFDCQLKPEQVKNLCKLFQITTRERGSMQVGRLGRLESRTLIDRYGIEERHQVQQGVRHPAFGAVKPFPENTGLHERGVLGSAALSSQLPVPLHSSLPPPSYAYEGLPDPVYRRRDAEFEHHHHRQPIEIGLDHREEVALSDPYILKGPTQSGESFYPMGLPGHRPLSLHRY